MDTLKDIEYTQTEQRIITAAREIFARKGFDGARMHEISEKAGINSALLHYYFRNKKKLFERVFEQLLSELIDTLFKEDIDSSNFDKYIFNFSKNYIDFFRKNEYIPIFIIQEIRDNPEWIINTFRKTQISQVKFFKEITKLNDVNSKFQNDFEPLLNLVSMLLFPIIARPLLQFLLNINDEEYNKMIESRKQTVPQFFLDYFKPKKVKNEK